MASSETMFDSVNTLDIPSDATLILAYIDGDYANLAAVTARFPHATIIPVTTTSSGSLNAQVYDCERGDGNAVSAALWASRKVSAKQRPTIYCSRIGSPGYGWPDVQKQVANLKLTGQVDYGIADYTSTPHLIPGSAFTQYANPPSSGGDYDISITNGIWPNLPSEDATMALAKPASAIVATKSGKGYWIVAQDGGVFNYGDAGFFNSLPGLKVTPNAPIVGFTPTPTEQGYWLLGADGGVFCFGDALFHGSAS
jgi:hypothetical protein